MIPSIFSDHNTVRLDVSYRIKTIKSYKIWRLYNTLLNKQQIEKEIKICMETNENENSTTQNLWGTVKAVLRRRLIAIQPYLKKQDKSQINNLTLHLNQLEMKNPRVSRWKEILKISAEINEKETTETFREHLTGGFLRAVSHKSSAPYQFLATGMSRTAQSSQH